MLALSQQWGAATARELYRCMRIVCLPRGDSAQARVRASPRAHASRKTELWRGDAVACVLSSTLPQAGVIRAGARNTLRWLSGGDGRGRVAIERWCTRSAAWRLELEAPDSGSATWRAPARLDAPLLLRVRALGEAGVEHVTQMPLA